MPEKQRNPLIEKLRAQVIEREQNQAMINGASSSHYADESMPEDNGADTSQIKQSNSGGEDEVGS